MAKPVKKEEPVIEEASQSPDYETKISELEKKLGDLSSTIDAQNEFIQGASVVINTLAYTPELRDSFQSALKKQYGVVGEGQGVGQQQQQTNPQAQTTQVSPDANNDITKQVGDIAASQRESIIGEFEKQYGIDSLKDEEKRDARRKVESYLNDFGWSVKTIPLSNLKNSLDRAYVGTHAEKLKEEGKLEGFAQARQNDMGMMSSFPSGTPQTTTQSDLSDKQKEWIKKLGANEEKAKEVYLNKDEEFTRVSKAEEKKTE